MPSFPLNATRDDHPCHPVPCLPHESTVNVTKCNTCHAKGAARPTRATRMDCRPKRPLANGHFGRSQNGLGIRRMDWAPKGEERTNGNLNVRIIDLRVRSITSLNLLICSNYASHAETISAPNCASFCGNHAVFFFFGRVRHIFVAELTFNFCRG